MSKNPRSRRKREEEKRRQRQKGLGHMGDNGPMRGGVFCDGSGCRFAYQGVGFVDLGGDTPSPRLPRVSPLFGWTPLPLLLPLSFPCFPHRPRVPAAKKEEKREGDKSNTRGLFFLFARRPDSAAISGITCGWRNAPPPPCPETCGVVATAAAAATTPQDRKKATLPWPCR